MYKKLKQLKKEHQAAYSLLIIFGVVAVWRGLWGLFDLYVFPGNPALSFVTTLALGIIIIGATHYKLS